MVGHGSITGMNEVTVNNSNGEKYAFWHYLTMTSLPLYREVVQTKNILVATGSVPMPFPGLEVSDYAYSLLMRAN